jgi:putative ABC transport system ATP-binding protein
MSADAAVRLSGVSKAFGRGDTLVQALRGVDLEVLPGELMMLVGPSGCGKTTLLSVAAGILDHDAGTCRIFGQDIGALSDRALVRFRGSTLGFVFQSFNLIPALSAAENVAVPLFLQGVPRREALRRASELLDRVGLGGRDRSLPRELSGGQQQRVAIARAVIHRPRLVVCDEPTSALDQDTGHKVMELLRSLLLGDGRSLLVVTHDSRIFPFADRIAHMNDGRIDRVEIARVPQGGPA